MEENLVGYLLEALDAETHRQVEASLRASPQLQTRLQLLKRALAPLSADADAVEPPTGLYLSTLAHIAEHSCRKLPPAPPPPRSQVEVSARRRFRRADVLIAAMLLIVLGGIGATALLRAWRKDLRLECQNNLRLVSEGLHLYCDNHDGNFPRAEEDGPRAVAGIFVPILRDNRMLAPTVSVLCPAQGRLPPQCRSIGELEELYENQPEEFLREARKMAGNYAYTLGYQDANGYHGLRCDSGDKLPILADRLEFPSQLNSPNHGGEGQNVLFLGGNVAFFTKRDVGIGGDDIYLNRDNRVLAGKDREDTVLGSSETSPK